MRSNILIGMASSRKEQSEAICKTTTPLKVRVLDIRGREEEWFWCEQGDLFFTCETKYRGAWARIRVRPAIVVRNAQRAAVRDSHFHAFIEPLGGASSYIDLFARSQSRDLRQAELTLDTEGGGRGERADVDSYYIRVDFSK